MDHIKNVHESKAQIWVNVHYCWPTEIDKGKKDGILSEETIVIYKTGTRAKCTSAGTVMSSQLEDMIQYAIVNTECVECVEYPLAYTEVSYHTILCYRQCRSWHWRLSPYHGGLKRFTIYPYSYWGLILYHERYTRRYKRSQIKCIWDETCNQCFL